MITGTEDGTIIHQKLLANFDIVPVEPNLLSLPKLQSMGLFLIASGGDWTKLVGMQR